MECVLGEAVRPPEMPNSDAAQGRLRNRAAAPRLGLDPPAGDAAMAFTRTAAASKIGHN
jgi:hypothetical protein